MRLSVFLRSSLFFKLQIHTIDIELDQDDYFTYAHKWILMLEDCLPVDLEKDIDNITNIAAVRDTTEVVMVCIINNDKYF